MNKHLLSVIASIVICAILLIGCGGGGGGGTATAPVTSNVTVTVPGSLLTQPSGSERATTDGSSDFKLKVVAYSKGVKKTDVKIDDRQLTSNGIDYTANVDGLLNAYDYRFIAYYKDTEILSNQIALSELKNGATIPINIDTSIKTLAYDSWISKSPSNASVENFKKNCERSGLSKDKDFQNLIDTNAYKESIAKVVKGEKNVFLPKNDNIDTIFIATIDLEATLSHQTLIGTWYLIYEDDKNVVPNSKGEVPTMLLKSDGTCTMTDFDLTEYGHLGFYEPEGVAETDTGRWNYSNGKLTTVIDGYTMTVSVTLKDGSLTLNGTEPEPWTSVYNKTMYSGGGSVPVTPVEEPLTIDKNMVGTWYLNSKNNESVSFELLGGCIVETMILNSDGSFRIVEVFLFSREGTWGIDKDKKIHLKYKDFFGVDYEYETTLENNILTFIDGGDTYVFKKTHPEVNEKLIGTWYLNYVNYESDDSFAFNGSDDFLILNSDKSFIWANHWIDGEIKTGKWGFVNGQLYLKNVSKKFDNKEMYGDDEYFIINLDYYNDTLVIYDYVWGYSKKVYYKNFYKKTKDCSSDLIQELDTLPSSDQDLVGTWYLNYDGDGKPVMPDSNGEVDSLTLTDDGTFVMKSLEITYKGSELYTDIGKWSYSNGKLTLTNDGVAQSFSITLKNGELTLTFIYENSHSVYRLTSVYKKTKFSN